MDISECAEDRGPFSAGLIQSHSESLTMLYPYKEVRNKHSQHMFCSLSLSLSLLSPLPLSPLSLSLSLLSPLSLSLSPLSPHPSFSLLKLTSP